jgi:hypothetical protein
MAETVKAPRSAALKAELEAEKVKLEAELAPARELYERHVNDPAFLAAKRTIKELNAKLGPIQNELAALARAGGSKGIQVEPGEYVGNGNA